MFPFLRVSVRKKKKLFFDTFDIFMIFLRFFDGTEKENNYELQFALPVTNSLRVAGIFMTSNKN